MTSFAGIEEALLQLETHLLKQATRHKAQEVSSLLAEEFLEFGSSGKAFSKAEIMLELQNEPPLQLSLYDFKAHVLCDTIVQVTYHAVRVTPEDASVHTLRSSIWIFRDGRWQMFFHQGTCIPA